MLFDKIIIFSHERADLTSWKKNWDYFVFYSQDQFYYVDLRQYISICTFKTSIIDILSISSNGFIEPRKKYATWLDWHVMLFRTHAWWN